MSCSHRILTQSPQQTQDFGRVLGENAHPGDVILLEGPLGAGKTCLTQGIASGLDIPGYVRSPTFVLMTRYSGRLTLHHLDLYRVGNSQEAWDLGLDEQLAGDGLCVVEWPDRAPELFNKDNLEGNLWVKLGYSKTENQRQLVLFGGPEHYCAALSDLAAKYPLGQGGA